MDPSPPIRSRPHDAIDAGPDSERCVLQGSYRASGGPRVAAFRLAPFRLVSLWGCSIQAFVILFTV